jgi:hypothetical protein
MNLSSRSSFKQVDICLADNQNLLASSLFVILVYHSHASHIVNSAYTILAVELIFAYRTFAGIAA